MKHDDDLSFEKQVDGLIHNIFAHYGYDFREYSRASILRRIERFISNHHIKDLEALQLAIFNDAYFFEKFLQELTVNVTEMFRDPSFFLALRKKVLPMLSTYPHIKIWDAGCSSGEELFSLAILLKEEGLLKRCKIYATDINQKVLKQAREGVFSAKNIAAYTAGYYASGGKEAFSDYFSSNYGSLKFDASLIKGVTFYPHNLSSDFSFNEFNLIICRNVLIYFNRNLQERVLSLFDDSLVSLGYLALGKKESIYLSNIGKKYEYVDKDNRIYRKVQ